MNAVAFAVAVAGIGFLFPLFKGLTEDCFYAAGRHWKPGGRAISVFNVFLGFAFMALFFAICIFAVWLGTQSKRFFN